MTNEEFVLDTANMAQVAEKCKELRNSMLDLKQRLDNSEVKMVNSWLGDGSTAFQKKYHKLIQKLTDLKDELSDMAEDVLTALESYIQADVDASKTIDGVQEVGASGGKLTSTEPAAGAVTSAVGGIVSGATAAMEAAAGGAATGSGGGSR